MTNGKTMTDLMITHRKAKIWLKLHSPVGAVLGPTLFGQQMAWADADPR